MTTTAVRTDKVNGIDVAALRDLVAEVRANPASAQSRWGVTTRWKGGTVTETEVTGYELGGQRVARSFRFKSDEPLELGGTNLYPNPQELLMGSLNACMTVGYVAAAALFGITLESLEIACEGEIDVRGFLGVAPVKAGYDEIRYTVRIKGDGTEAQFREIHEIVMKTSPNRFNISQPVKLTGELVVE